MMLKHLVGLAQLILRASSSIAQDRTAVKNPKWIHCPLIAKLVIIGDLCYNQFCNTLPKT